MSRRVKSHGQGLTGTWIAHRLEMRASPAWAALPDNARRVLDRLELEHMRHGGADNGSLAVSYEAFAEVGLKRRHSIAVAIRQCVVLGFVRVERRGFLSASHARLPSLYRLTYPAGRGKSGTPTDEWRAIKSPEAAKLALREANKSAWSKQRSHRVDGRSVGRVMAGSP